MKPTKRQIMIVEDLVKKTTKQFLKESLNKLTIGQLIKSNDIGLNSIFIQEYPAHAAISLNVVPTDERSVQYFTTNADKIIKLINSDEFQNKILTMYSKKTKKEWEYIDDIYSTIQSLKYMKG